jgi:hypothetical protein
MVDEDLPFAEEGGRKSWYLHLHQQPDLLQSVGPVRGAPRNGVGLLLFEEDVVPLVQYLADSELVMPDNAGRIRNGPALEWDESTLPDAEVYGPKSATQNTRHPVRPANQRPYPNTQAESRCRIRPLWIR